MRSYVKHKWVLTFLQLITCQLKMSLMCKCKILEKSFPMKIVIVHVGMTNEKQRNENNPFSKIFLF